MNPLALNLEMTVGRFEERLEVRRTSQAHPSIVSYLEGERDGTLEAQVRDSKMAEQSITPPLKNIIRYTV